MKCLQIVPAYKPAFVYGGPIYSVSAICEELVKLGHQVAVLTTTANGQAELAVTPGEVQLVEGVEVIYFKRYTKDHTHLSPGLLTYLWKNIDSFDVVHIHSWWNLVSLFSVIICAIKGIRPVLSPRGMLSDYTQNANHSFSKKVIQALIGKPFLSKMKFHATSESEKQEILRLYPLAYVVVIYNFVAIPAYKISVNDDLQKGSKNILFLSRVTPKKGLELLFAALKNISWDFHLTIVGPYEPDYKLSLTRLLDKLALTSRVTWEDAVYGDQKFVLLSKSDFLILPSYNENFANIVIEALAFACPVLISDMVGLAPYVLERDLGWVTRVDVEDITRNLNLLHKQPAKLSRIRHSAPEIIARDFNGEHLVNSFISLYQSD